MATTTMAVISAAYAKLHQRILPATLKQTNENGRIMGEYVRAQGHDISKMTDSDLLASLMYEAANRQAERLDWLVKPKKLLIRNEVNHASQQDETKFADRVRAAADADAAKKLSDKSRGKTAGMISQMQLSSRGKTELYQGKLHQRVERAVKRGVKWDAIEADIRRKVSELYAADEKSQERVGQFQDTLSEVEL